MLYEEFKAVVRPLLEPPGAGSSTLVPIPVLRRAVGPRVTPEEFDVLLCALQRDGLVHLLTHVDPGALGDEERSACLSHPSGVLAYWVCWV